MNILFGCYGEIGNLISVNLNNPFTFNSFFFFFVICNKNLRIHDNLILIFYSDTIYIIFYYVCNA